MKAATISEIKKLLNSMPTDELAAMCIRLAKYKKENKELLHYLLYEIDDEEAYIKQVKKEMDALFSEIKKGNAYQTKKNLAKILRYTQKQIKYSGLKRTEVELLMYYCLKMRKSGRSLHNSLAITNIYIRQMAKIKKTIATLHEDLQFDYQEELNRLEY